MVMPPTATRRRARQLLRWEPLTGTVTGAGYVDESGSTVALMSREEGSGGGEGGQGSEENGAGAEGMLERFEWYRMLFDFSAGIPPPKSAGYTEEEDPDQNLVPQVGSRGRVVGWWFEIYGAELGCCSGLPGLVRVALGYHPPLICICRCSLLASTTP